MNNKTTSRSMGSKASKVMSNKHSSAIQKKLAGSALSQCNSSHRTGKSMETTASKVLKSNKYSSETKSLAASVLSQSDSKR